MKKLLCLLLAMVMLLSFAACDDGGRDRDDDDEKETVSENSPEGAYDLWFDCVTSVASENKLKSTMPDEVWEAAEDEYEDPYEEYTAGREAMIANWEDYYGENYRITYEIQDQEEMSIEDIEEELSNLEYYYNIDPDSVEEAVMLTIEIQFKGDEEDTVEDQALMVKIDGTWYNYTFIL